MAKFAWCEQNKHTDCIKSYVKFYVDAKNNVIRGDQRAECECGCHES